MGWRTETVVPAADPTQQITHHDHNNNNDTAFPQQHSRPDTPRYPTDSSYSGMSVCSIRQPPGNPHMFFGNKGHGGLAEKLRPSESPEREHNTGAMITRSHTS